jgi:hypothetical protein
METRNGITDRRECGRREWLVPKNYSQKENGGNKRLAPFQMAQEKEQKTIQKTSESLDCHQQHYKTLTHSGATSSLALHRTELAEEERLTSQLSGRTTDEGSKHNKLTVTELNSTSYSNTVSATKIQPIFLSHALPWKETLVQSQVLYSEKKPSFQLSGNQKSPFLKYDATSSKTGVSVPIIPQSLQRSASLPTLATYTTDNCCSTLELSADSEQKNEQLSPQATALTEETKLPVTNDEAVAISVDKVVESDYTGRGRHTEGQTDSKPDTSMGEKETAGIWKECGDHKHTFKTVDLVHGKHGRRRQPHKRQKGDKGKEKHSPAKRQTNITCKPPAEEEDRDLFEGLLTWQQDQTTEQQVKQADRDIDEYQECKTAVCVNGYYRLPDLCYYPRPSTSRSKSINNKKPPFNIDDIVWAKLVDRPWWPAQVISFIQDKEEIKQTMLMVTVQWLGRPTWANVLPSSLISPFAETFHKYFMPKKKSKPYIRAIEEALELSGFNPNSAIPEILASIFGVVS